MNKPVGIDYALMAAIALAWGSQFVFNALAIESFHPLTVAAGRVFIGFITLYLAVMLILKESVAIPATINKQPWGLYCGIALAEAILPCFLIPWGQQNVDSSIAAILLATVPIFTLLLAPMFVKEEKLTLMATFSAIIGFIGVVFLVTPNIKGNPLADVIGELAILGGALSFSLSLIMMKRLPDVSPVVAMRNVFGIAAIPLVIFALILDEPWTVRIERGIESAGDPRAGRFLRRLSLCHVHLPSPTHGTDIYRTGRLFDHLGGCVYRHRVHGRQTAHE